MKKRFAGQALGDIPGYSICAIMYDSKKMYDTAGTVPGEESAIFSDAYRRANVWGVFPLIGESYEKRLTRPSTTR